MPNPFPPVGTVHSKDWNSSSAKLSHEQFKAEQKAKKDAIKNRRVVDYFAGVDPDTLPKPYRPKRR